MLSTYVLNTKYNRTQYLEYYNNTACINYPNLFYYLCSGLEVIIRICFDFLGKVSWAIVMHSFGLFESFSRCLRLLTSCK